MRARFALSLVVPAFVAACASHGPNAGPDTAAHKAHDAYVTAINSNNIDAILDMLTEDVVFMPPNEPSLVGKAAVRPWGEGYLKAFTIHWDKTSLEFVVAGDWAYERYAYKSSDTPRDGSAPVTDTGKGINIYRRGADGKWRIARDAWNSDLPAAR